MKLLSMSNEIGCAWWLDLWNDILDEICSYLSLCDKFSLTKTPQTATKIPNKEGSRNLYIVRDHSMYTYLYVTLNDMNSLRPSDAYMRH